MWLGLIHAFSSHIPRSTLKNFCSKQKQPLCWGEKWHLCSVGNQNLERDKQKTLNVNGIDLLQAPLEVSLTPVFPFLEKVPD